MNSIDERNVRLRKSVIDWMDREERPQSWIARKTDIFPCTMTQWLKGEKEFNGYTLNRIEEYIKNKNTEKRISINR